MSIITILKGKIKSPVYRNTLIYTLTDALSKGLSFLTLPFISYYLIPEQLGIAANFDVLATILCLLAGQATVNGLPYFYYDRNKESVAKLISNLIFIIIIALSALSVVILLCSNIISGYLHLGLMLQLLTVLSVITTLLMGIDTIVYRLENKPISFAILQILQTIIYLGLLCWLVIGAKMEALGKIYSLVATNVIMATIHTVLLYKRGFICFTVDKESIMTLLKFGIPLMPHSISFWLKGGMDKILLTTYCGLAANGLYSMAMSFGVIYSIFNTAFSNAYVPYLQERLTKITPENEQAENLSIVQWSYKIMIGFVGLYFFVLIACWIAIEFILSDNYAGSMQFIPWILLALLFQSFYSMVIQFPYSKKKTLGLGIITFSCAIIQMLLTFTLVRQMGVNGIKYSLVIGSLLTMLGVWWYSNKIYPMPWFNFYNK